MREPPVYPHNVDKYTWEPKQDDYNVDYKT